MGIFSLLYVLFVIFLVSSPFIAIVSIVKWITHKGKRGGDQWGFSDGYQKGVRDTFDYVRGIEGEVTHERLNVLQAQMLKDSGYKPVATPGAPVAWWQQPLHIPGMELPDEKTDSMESAGDMGSAMDLESTQPDTAYSESSYDELEEHTDDVTVAGTFSLSSVSGVNLLLSLSSLLFVAAGIAFIASPFSDSGKLFVLICIVALFYGGGIALHKTIERLRPAAVSFVGTGLALIPFLGIAFVQYTNMSVPAVWLLVSALGLVAYVAAAFILQSSVVSYLSMAFLLSLASSVVANASLPVVYYFASFTALSLCASVIAHSKPKWVPQLFSQPVAQTGNIITPVVAFVSLFWLGRLSLREYELIFCLTTLQYIVAWVQTRAVWYEQAARAVAHLTALVFVFDFSGGFTPAFGVGLLETAVLQHAYSLARWGKTKRPDIEQNWSVAMITLQAISMVWWPDKWMWVAATATVLVTSVCTVIISSRKEFGAATLYALFILPIVVGIGAATPQWPYGGVALWYLLMAAGVMAAQYWLRARLDTVLAVLVKLGFWLFVAAAFIAGFAELGVAASLVLLITAVCMIFGMSYLVARPQIMALVAALVPVVLLRYCLSVSNPSFNVLIIFAGSAMVMYAFAAVLLATKDRLRGNISLVAGHAYLLPALAFGVPAAYSPLVLWQEITLSAVMIAAAYGFWLFSRFDTSAPARQSAHQVFCAIYYIVGLFISLQLPAWWLSLAILVGVILLWEASYHFASAPLAGFANAGVVWMLWVALGASLRPDSPVALWAFGIAMAVFYAAMLVFRVYNDEPRRQIMLWSVWIASIAAFLAGYVAPGYGVMASMLLMGGAASMIHEGWRIKYLSLVELGTYIVAFGFCQLVNSSVPGTTAVFYAHIAALAVAIMAAVYGNDTTRYQVAAGILTLFVGGAALADGGGYSALFLTEQIILSAFGAMTQRRWATWWGVIGAVAAIFYYLHENSFMIFMLLGLLIVAYVIMRLSRKPDN